MRVAPGDLLAIDLDPGPAWPDLVRRLWADGVAFLPLDRRLSGRERGRIVDLARPAAVVDGDGEATLFAASGPVDSSTALVVATSGTAGVPKLVELSRSAIAAAIAGSVSTLGVTGNEPWVACLPPAHIGGMLVLLRGAIGGAPVTALERFDANSVLDVSDGAFVSVVPSMVVRLLETGRDLSSTALLVGGGALEPGVRRAAEERGGRIVSTYGLTECAGGVVYDGRPFAETEVRVVTTPDGGPGQIELGGPTLMEGYLHDPAATGAVFTTDGWLRTGDAGALDAGILTVHGRLDDAIRTGGETVWPLEVERSLRDHPRVADVAVAGRPHPEWGSQVTAFVVPADPTDPPGLEELRDHASETIARFKTPRELVLLEELPRTPSGKLRRGQLT
jgi:O-succinylbenzoic acid--CoA ligase